VHAHEGFGGEFLVDFAEELGNEVAGIGALFRRYAYCLATWMEGRSYGRASFSRG
jgi:hypothetical protein